MTPEAIAADPSLHRRFLTEIAHLDRPLPSDEEVSADLDLLASSDGGVVVAWLWPDRFQYDADRDPFDDVARDVSDLERRVAERLEVEGIEHATEAVACLLDQWRSSHRRARVERFEQIVASTAQAVDRPVEDLLAHLRWSVPLTERDLGDLVLSRTPFPLGVIAAIGRALQLELDTSLVLVDPERLVRRVDESILALSIADHLRRLTLDNLEAVGRKLHRGSGGAASADPPAYAAPEDGARYSALYEVLAGDEREHLRLTLDEIDRILADGGERPLPASARTDRSWWAGTGAKPQGRPQISAWWGAGYRVFSLETDRSSGHLTSVGFEALPGRASWLADAQRRQAREYRPPEPYRVSVFPWNERHADNARAGLRTFVELVEPALRRLATEGPPDEEADRVPSDPDVRMLVELLGEVGEASRAQVRDHFARRRGEPAGDAWITNVLTRARRQGWTVNLGTRKQPRWVLVDRTCPSCGARSLEPITVLPSGAKGVATFAEDERFCPRCNTFVTRSPGPATAPD